MLLLLPLLLPLGSACRSSPAEAPPPDASAWPDEGMGPGADAGADPSMGPDVDPGPPPAHASEVPALSPAMPRPPRTIFRNELQRAIGPGPAYLLRQLGPTPFRHQGRFVGWEITRLFPDDPLLCTEPCDLAVGDVILEVNGHRLQTPQELSDALQALPDWTHLRVHSLRNGQRREVTYVIAETGS